MGKTYWNIKQTKHQFFSYGISEEHASMPRLHRVLSIILNNVTLCFGLSFWITLMPEVVGNRKLCVLIVDILQKLVNKIPIYEMNPIPSTMSLSSSGLF